MKARRIADHQLTDQPDLGRRGVRISRLDVRDLLLQVSDERRHALFRDVVVRAADVPANLLQPPVQFFLVACLVHVTLRITPVEYRETSVLFETETLFFVRQNGHLAG